ncbi:uncharacterized protein LOC121409457 isoform X2 [Lytechinus variegatus]|uniref:uncharacterized protein LOC121409457 isoform X2 n=1 Tax=Lytechinus variegatus TaxID=7654 RepID=UPI001BB12443|nr:uncharacterized protein LOC121409457 isoform X2 [Lytechinus variegatus]
MKIFILLSFITLASAATDPECSSHDHDIYGCSGECITTGSCPAGKYQSNLCPTQPNDVKCCFTADTDSECAEYNHATYGQVGKCVATSQCPYNNYISNLCPSKAADVKCCFSKPSGTCGGGGGGTRQDLACEILNHPGVDLLSNNGYLNPDGWNDGADALSNIRDTCNGGAAKRSTYCCSSGCCPGGSVYLSTSVLSYILDLLNNGYNLQVNTLAGACHSQNSWHYSGTAVDFQIFSGSPYSTWMSYCSAHGARENLGPGYPGHDTHTHCAFSS